MAMDTNTAVVRQGYTIAVCLVGSLACICGAMLVASMYAHKTDVDIATISMEKAKAEEAKAMWEHMQQCEKKP